MFAIFKNMKDNFVYDIDENTINLKLNYLSLCLFVSA